MNTQLPEKIYAREQWEPKRPEVWTFHLQFPDDVEYVRADIHKALMEEELLARQGQQSLKDQLAALQRQIDEACAVTESCPTLQHMVGAVIEGAKLKDQLAQSQESLMMANGCLEMVRELLATELDMTHTPPMMYPEAIAAVVQKKIAEALAGLTAPGGEGWMPIETAPRDGKPILACYWSGADDNWMAQYSQWRAPFTCIWRGFHPNAPGKQQWRSAHGRPESPTHWRPLPPPPVTADSGKEGA